MITKFTLPISSAVQALARLSGLSHAAVKLTEGDCIGNQQARFVVNQLAEVLFSSPVVGLSHDRLQAAPYLFSLMGIA